MNKKTSLILLTTITSTFVALCAAVFSISGIAKLFSGAALATGIMASALELGKLVSISFLYQYWKLIPKALKVYLSTASLILMLITSAGIYGYLSAAYATVAADPLKKTADIQTAEVKLVTIEHDIQRKNDRLNQLIALRTQQENRVDALISKSQSGNSSAIRTAQSSLAIADNNVKDIQKELSQLSEIRDSLNSIKIAKQVEIETNGDVGTFIYIAKTLNTSLDVVVKWFILIIVLVFDPLAIALVLAVNFLLKLKNDEPAPVVDLPKPTESLGEPFEIYKEPVKEEPQVSYITPSDPQYFARGDFDWRNKALWENNPAAVKYYNERMKHIIEGT